MKCGTYEEFRAACVTDLTTNGHCPEGCGECCSNLLPCTEYELDRLARYAKDHNIMMVKEHASIPMANKVIDMCCPFRNEEKRICEVYDVRPAICKEYMCNFTRGVYTQGMLKMIAHKPIMLRDEMRVRGVK